MPLSTPAGCVGGGLASPRIGPESLSQGSRAGPDSASDREQHGLRGDGDRTLSHTWSAVPPVSFQTLLLFTPGGKPEAR